MKQKLNSSWAFRCCRCGLGAEVGVVFPHMVLSLCCMSSVWGWSLYFWQHPSPRVTSWVCLHYTDTFYVVTCFHPSLHYLIFLLIKKKDIQITSPPIEQRFRKRMNNFTLELLASLDVFPPMASQCKKRAFPTLLPTGVCSVVAGSLTCAHVCAHVLHTCYVLHTESGTRCK